MRKLFVYCLLACLACMVPLSGMAAEKAKKTILFLDSYHHGYRWSDSIIEGFRTVMDASQYKIDLQIEYLDAKKYGGEESNLMLFRLYSEKFRDENFDVIITSDNDAFAFATKYRDILFPGVPLVFCGINDIDDVNVAQPELTGVVENFDPATTLDVVGLLNPEKKHMVVVGDESTAGVAIRRQVEAVVPQYSDRYTVEYWSEMTLDEVIARVAGLPDDTFLFLIPYYVTIDGRFYTSEEIMEAIYASSRVPIYTSWEFLLGHGAVGGRLISGFNHGEMAADMALRILGGESASDIPIHSEPSGEFAFDYKVMQHLNIDQRRLPEGSRLINAPSPFYELPKELFWIIMISFALLSIVMVFLVITMIERRKVERKIKDQLAFQETLMDTVPQLVSWKDVGGRYLGTNRAFAEFFGLDASGSVAQKTSRDLMRDQSYVEWATSADKAVVTRKTAFRKVRRKLTDAKGAQAWLEINKVPIRDQSGRIVGILSTAENITKERNLERQLLQSQKMEAIGTLAGGIAHDFNNILTSIINSTELAVGDIDPETVTARDLERVLKAARRGGRVVKQILAFSRPSTEGFRPTEVGGVVSEVLGLLEASMPGNIDVRSRIAPALACVNADPNQIHQVVMNLCTNAFQALRATGGVIEVRVEAAILRGEEARMLGITPGEYIRMAVEDDGPGIPAEIVDKIFDPFFSTKDKTEGTGLGLAVVHGIIRSHGGGLSVSHRSGGGTVFQIYLPQVENIKQGKALVGVELPIKEARILFVEDDEDQLTTSPRLLESMGLHVTAMSDPEAALKHVRDLPHAFDLLITDYDMPGMSGTQLAALVHEAVPGLPIILVSGREDAAAAASHLPNIRQVVIKPYDKRDLTIAIGGVLENEE